MNFGILFHVFVDSLQGIVKVFCTIINAKDLNLCLKLDLNH